MMENVRDPLSSYPPLAPPKAAGQAISHDIGTGSGAESPEAVKPAHVAGSIVQSHVVIKRCIDRSRAKAIRDGPQAQQDKGTGYGKSK